jgi:methylated-DNA-[protein]-cysteine S-methyltransferase
MTIYKTYYESPIGWVEISSTEQEISEILFVEQSGDISSEIPPVLANYRAQIEEYFNKQRQQFSVALAPQGTAFQKQVWSELQNIPYGQTRSYLEISTAINNPKAVRAVGQANGRNPISIIVPCHRVIGNDGDLVGYGGGLWRKKWLLEHEGIKLDS